MAKETVLQAIIAHIFGHKYYANIINTRGTNKCEISSFIHRSKEEAEKQQSYKNFPQIPPTTMVQVGS